MIRIAAKEIAIDMVLKRHFKFIYNIHIFNIFLIFYACIACVILFDIYICNIYINNLHRYFQNGCRYFNNDITL